MPEARSNDIVPNGPIVPIPSFSLPGTLTLSDYQTNGNPGILNCICTGTFSVSTIALPTAGVAHAASTEQMIPVRDQPTLYINGSGTFSSTLYTTRDV